VKELISGRRPEQNTAEATSGGAIPSLPCSLAQGW